MGRVPINRIDVDPRTGCVVRFLHDDGDFDVASWGCEFGNWFGFFSQARMGGTAVDILRKEVMPTAECVETRFEVRLPGGHYCFEGRDYLDQGEIRRRYVLRAIEESTLGDFVIRAALCGGRWSEGRIAGKRLMHSSKNRMYQYATSEASVCGGRWSLGFQTLDTIYPATLDNLLYLRDEPPGLWILHHRLLTRNGACDEYVLRIRRRIWSSRANPIVGNPVLRKMLWRFAERVPLPIPTVLAGGNIVMKAGDELVMSSKMYLDRCDEAAAT